jgi:hypothetical protein
MTEENNNDIGMIDLRNELKSFVASELKNLPQSLKELDQKKRIDVLLKLMPFVFPKVHNISYTTNDKQPDLQIILE